MWVTRTFRSKFDYGEMVVFDNECSTRHKQVCKIVDIDGQGAPWFVYKIQFVDGFVIDRVNEYDLSAPTLEEQQKYSNALHCGVVVERKWNGRINKFISKFIIGDRVNVWSEDLCQYGVIKTIEPVNYKGGIIFRYGVELDSNKGVYVLFNEKDIGFDNQK